MQAVPESGYWPAGQAHWPLLSSVRPPPHWQPDLSDFASAPGSINLQIVASQFAVALHRGSYSVPGDTHCVLGPAGSYYPLEFAPISPDPHVLHVFWPAVFWYSSPVQSVQEPFDVSYLYPAVQPHEPSVVLISYPSPSQVTQLFI